MADSYTSKKELKDWFVTGAKPTQEQFWAWMDSYWHKSETISIANITDLATSLTSKANTSDLNTLSGKVSTITSSLTNMVEYPTSDDKQYVIYNGGLTRLVYFSDSTYDDLKTLKSTRSLIPGMWYRFDFKTIYKQPGTNIVMGLHGQTNDLEQDVSSLEYTMLIQATTTSTFAKEVKIVEVYDSANNQYHDYTNYCHLWTVEYMFDNDTTRCAWIDADQSMGAITRLIDHNGNESYYDHLNIRFRVYAIDTSKITVYSATNTYTPNSDLVWTDSNKTTIAYITSKKQLMPITIIDSYTSKYQSFSSTRIDRYHITIPVVATDYIDRTTFDNYCYKNYLSKTDFTDLQANVFTRSTNVALPNYSQNNHISLCNNIQFTSSENYNNILIYSSAITLGYNPDTNTLISSNNITILDLFCSNNLYNAINSVFYQNISSVELYTCYNVHLKGDNTGIYIKNCYQTTIEQNASSITLPLNVKNLTIRQNASSLDLYLSTQLSTDMSKEIIIDEDKACRLLYYGNNGVAQLTSPTA